LSHGLKMMLRYNLVIVTVADDSFKDTNCLDALTKNSLVFVDNTFEE
jgi:hypothetical protein